MVRAGEVRVKERLAAADSTEPPAGIDLGETAVRGV
jgi:hypothetical protein